MSDALLAELARLFDSVDPPPPVCDPLPTGFTHLTEHSELVRGPEHQLSFRNNSVRVHLQLGGGRLVGLVPPDTAVGVHSPQAVLAYRSDASGWFFADVRRGPLCVTLPDLRLTTGWFVG